MAWLQITIELAGANPAPLEAALEENGALAITLCDAGDQPLLEPGVGETPLWDAVTLSALFDTQIDKIAVESLAGAHGGGNVAWTRVEDRAWEREWLTRFAPQQFGQRLWIIPGDMPPPDPAAINVRLDPGLAFGTGDHPTTALCLAWIGNHELSGRRVLDYGCGSGILAIAALKSGAQGATAVDIDPQALLATRDNAERNDVGDKLLVLAPDALPPGEFDVVFANILAQPLIDLATDIAARVRPDGWLTLSGILNEQAQHVMSAYADSIDWSERQSLGDWTLLGGRRTLAR